MFPRLSTPFNSPFFILAVLNHHPCYVFFHKRGEKKNTIWPLFPEQLWSKEKLEKEVALAKGD
jgi:hypothetical protein